MMAINERLYAERDIEELGDYRMRHLLAMTAEALHSKSEIADELAYRDKIIDDLRAQLAAKPAPVECEPDNVHPDDIAVNKFAAAMKEKLEKKRAQGYGGWDDKDRCPVEHLQNLLIGHLAKGDPVDIGNFAMMLWNRGESAAAPPTIDAETRAMVLELCDKYEMECERTMISSDEHDPLIQQLRERMGNHD